MLIVQITLFVWVLALALKVLEKRAIPVTTLLLGRSPGTELKGGAVTARDVRIFAQYMTVGRPVDWKLESLAPIARGMRFACIFGARLYCIIARLAENKQPRACEFNIILCVGRYLT
jgi:hypothetical protein